MSRAAHLVQCVPNFSVGRDTQTVQAISDAAGACVVDYNADADHNRCVLTLVGPPQAVFKACAAACATAIGFIDMAAHDGVHPRLGSVDVVPFVPAQNITLHECAALSVEFARALSERHALPVFLYEAAAGGRALPFVRKHAFLDIMPDFGPRAPHPSAGAAVVGAREPLIACNVNLADANIRAAKRIARELRVEFVGVRALGLYLPSRGTAQVSMNITRPAQTSLASVFGYVERRAAELGTRAVSSEIISQPFVRHDVVPHAEEGLHSADGE